MQFCRVKIGEEWRRVKLPVPAALPTKDVNGVALTDDADAPITNTTEGKKLKVFFNESSHYEIRWEGNAYSVRHRLTSFIAEIII